MYETIEQYKGYDITAHGNGFTVFIDGEEFYNDTIKSTHHLIDIVAPVHINDSSDMTVDDYYRNNTSVSDYYINDDVQLTLTDCKGHFLIVGGLRYTVEFFSANGQVEFTERLKDYESAKTLFNLIIKNGYTSTPPTQDDLNDLAIKVSCI